MLKRLGKNMKAYRKKRGLTQEEAAFRSRLGYKRWQRLESGRSNTTLLTLGKIAAVLRTDIQKLVSR